MILLIDDFRTLRADRIARTFQEGIDQLMTKTPKILLLDHDLGSENPKETGYGIIEFMEYNPDIRPEEVRIVSSNPVGVGNIQMGLISMGYKVNYTTGTYFYETKRKQADE